jgi:hypothetical protein
MPLHRGKVATKPEILSVRSLTREDLSLLLEKRVGEDGRPLHIGAVQRFRDPHHRVARLFASGLRKAEIAERSGYSIQRIDTLFADPAFQQLIAKYREKVDEAFVANVDEFYEQATANMRMAERQIAERLEAAEDEDASPIPLKTLVDIAGDRMDRFGYGKRQTNLNVNADFASLLEKAIARSGKVIEAVVSPPVPTRLQSPPRLESPLDASEESLIPIEADSSPLAPQSPVRDNRAPILSRPAQGPNTADEVPFRRRA